MPNDDSARGAFGRWARGYGVIRHSAATRTRIRDLVARLSSEGRRGDGGDPWDILHALDRVTSAALWLVVHETYARTVYLDGRRLETRDFKPRPEGHTGGALNMVPAYAAYLAANALTGTTRAWLMGQGHCVAAVDSVNLLVGNILLVSKGEVIRAALLYIGIGAFHFALRQKFHLISFDAEEAERQGMSVRLWDFLFYATFGLVVTSFVRIAGVYLVFSYLIVPAVCGALMSPRTAVRLTIGWVVALTAGLTGLLLSAQWESMDLPTGPTIVCTFGLLLVVCGAIVFLKSRRSPEPA